MFAPRVLPGRSHFTRVALLKGKSTSRSSGSRTPPGNPGSATGLVVICALVALVVALGVLLYLMGSCEEANLLKDSQGVHS